MPATPQKIRPFVWSALPSVGRELPALIARARRSEWGQLHLVAGLGRLSELLECAVSWRHTRLGQGADVTGAALCFTAPGGGGWLRVRFDPSLAEAVVSRLLKQPSGLRGDATELSPALQGAMARLLVEAARSAGLALLPSATLGHAAELTVTGLLLVDGEPYALSFELALPAAPGASDVRTSRPETLSPAGLPITVPLCAAVFLARRSLLASLEPGDAVSLGEQWWIDHERRGRLVLASSAARRGAFLEITGPSSAKLTAALAELEVKEQDMTQGDEQTLSEIVGDAALDAPVQVRVEVAEVTLAARAWGSLGVGDVIRTETPIGHSAHLTVAGRRVARGELVNIDGELGVRILEIVRSEAP